MQARGIEVWVGAEGGRGGPQSRSLVVETTPLGTAGGGRKPQVSLTRADEAGKALG